MSRLTFRDAQKHRAWQKQLRDHYLNEGAPVDNPQLKDGLVRAVSRRIAEQVILKYEWLGTMSKTSYHYGIFWGIHCAGVCCVGTTVTGGTSTHMPFKIKRHELLTLARGACVHWSPAGANSKLVAWTCKLAAKDTGAKVMIAYSDTDAGEIGTIYQACNWVYIGAGSSTAQWVSPDGRIHDAKYSQDILRTKANAHLRRGDIVNILLAEGWTRQQTNPKHRYVCVLDKKDKALIDRIESMRLPYPKRELADA